MVLLLKRQPSKREDQGLNPGRSERNEIILLVHLFSWVNVLKVTVLIIVYWLEQRPANREDHGSIPGESYHCQLIFRCGV